MTEAKDIQLSKGMLRLLRRFARKDSVDWEELEGTEEAESLYYYSLICISRSGKYASISQKGKQVLLLHENKAKEQRSNRRHNWLIAIFSTVGGALLSRPIWAVLEWIAEFF